MVCSQRVWRVMTRRMAVSRIGAGSMRSVLRGIVVDSVVCRGRCRGDIVSRLFGGHLWFEDGFGLVRYDGVVRVLGGYR